MKTRTTFLLSLVGVCVLSFALYGHGFAARLWRPAPPLENPPLSALPVAAATSAPFIMEATPAATRANSSGGSLIAAPGRVTPTPTPTPRHQPVVESIALSGFAHEWQTWNNCGPATLSMNLSYFGSTLNQANVADILRPNRDDKNVSPHELVDYAQDTGYRAFLGVNGSPDLLRLFLSNNIPVIVETWHIPEPNDGMGHYRLLTGFDDANQRWIAHDAYDYADPVPAGDGYAGIYLPYTETDALWDVFNRVYVVIYTDGQAPLVESILGRRADPTVMWQQAAIHARFAVKLHPENAFSWFNLGSDLVALGQYEEAAAAYDQAQTVGLPWRMHWYQFGPFQAYYETGRYTDVIALADATLRTVDAVEELHYWRGKALLALGDTPAARQAFEHALVLNRNYTAAVEALGALAR